MRYFSSSWHSKIPSKKGGLFAIYNKNNNHKFVIIIHLERLSILLFLKFYCQNISLFFDNFKLPSMQSWQMSDLQRFFKSFVWSSINYISRFLLLKTVYFPLRVLCKSDLRISCFKSAMEKLSKFNTYWVRKKTVSSIFFIKVSRVSLKIGLSHLFMKDHLKSRLQLVPVIVS